MNKILICLLTLTCIGAASLYAQTADELIVGDHVRVVWKDYVLHNVEGIVRDISDDSISVSRQDLSHVVINRASIRRIFLYPKGSGANNLASLAAGDLIRVQKKASVLPPQTGRFAFYDEESLVLENNGRQYNIALKDIGSLKVYRGGLKTAGTASTTFTGVVVGAALGGFIGLKVVGKHRSCNDKNLSLEHVFESTLRVFVVPSSGRTCPWGRHWQCDGWTTGEPG